MFRLLLLLLVVSCAHQTPSVSELCLDPEMTAFSYPYTVSSMTLSSQGQNLKFAYMSQRPQKANGQTVLLLHGKNFAGFYWKPIMDKLLELGFHVVVPDQIGFGKSTKPQHYQYSFHQLAQNTLELMKHLGVEKFTVIGHSMGGMLATRIGLMAPEKVSRLVLMNPIGLEDWKTKIPYTSVDKIYANELKQNADSIREYQKNSYYDGQWKPEYEAMIKAASAQTCHPDYPLVAWNSALTYDMVFTQPVLYEFPLLKAKTLLIIGTRDRTALGKMSVSEEVRKTLGRYEVLGKQTAKAIPNAQLVELPGVGHMPQVEALPQTLEAIEKFLVIK